MQSSLVCPRRFLEYKKSEGLIPNCEPPHTVIFTYQRSFFNEALSNLAHTQLTGSLHRLFMLDEHPSIAIGHFGIGAPHVGAKMDIMIAWGVKRFISFGTAGSLQPNLDVGDIVLCDRAIRDEGLSHHYLPRGRDVVLSFASLFLGWPG